MIGTAYGGAGVLVFRAPRDAMDWQEIHALRRRDRFAENPAAYDLNQPDDQNPDILVRLLTVNGSVVGSMRIDLHSPDFAAFRLVVIDPNRRNRGYGAAMLAEAEAFVRANGVPLVRLHALPDAVAFYRRNGYVDLDWDEPAQNPACVDMGKYLQA